MLVGLVCFGLLGTWSLVLWSVGVLAVWCSCCLVGDGWLLFSRSSVLGACRSLVLFGMCLVPGIWYGVYVLSFFVFWWVDRSSILQIQKGTLEKQSDTDVVDWEEQPLSTVVTQMS
jgi:hypothetical protein